MEDRCIMCGEYVPEGRQVCKVCEQQILNNNKQISKSKKKSYIHKPYWVNWSSYTRSSSGIKPYSR